MARTTPRHRRGPGYLIGAVTLLLASAGCGSGGVAGAPVTPTTAPAAQSGALPTPQQTGAAAALPVTVATLTAAKLPPPPAPPSLPPATPRPTPTSVEAHSPRVEPGRAYDFTLNSDCGAASIIDFDGAFWTWAGGGWPRVAMGHPSQRGTMTLTGPDEARFDYPGGSLRFKRHQGSLAVAWTCR